MFISWQNNSSRRLRPAQPARAVVINRIADGLLVSRNVLEEHQEKTDPGQRLADRVASFWRIMAIYHPVPGALVAWIVVNTLILAEWNHTFDPYPYILLNLVLSMLAAIQAPVIMMSQNRHSEKTGLMPHMTTR